MKTKGKTPGVTAKKGRGPMWGGGGGKAMIPGGGSKGTGFLAKAHGAGEGGRGRKMGCKSCS